MPSSLRTRGPQDEKARRDVSSSWARSEPYITRSPHPARGPLPSQRMTAWWGGSRAAKPLLHQYNTVILCASRGPQDQKLSTAVSHSRACSGPYIIRSPHPARDPRFRKDDSIIHKEQVVSVHPAPSSRSLALPAQDGNLLARLASGQTFVPPYHAVILANARTSGRDIDEGCIRLPARSQLNNGKRSIWGSTLKPHRYRTIQQPLTSSAGRASRRPASRARPGHPSSREYWDPGRRCRNRRPPGSFRSHHPKR